MSQDEVSGAADALYSTALAADYPTYQEVIRLKGDLRCYQVSHGTTLCPSGCRTGAVYLASKHYLNRHKIEGSEDTYSIAARLVQHTAYLEFKGDHVLWDKLEQDINVVQFTDDNHSGNALVTTAKRLLAYWKEKRDDAAGSAAEDVAPGRRPAFPPTVWPAPLEPSPAQQPALTAPAATSGSGAAPAAISGSDLMQAMRDIVLSLQQNQSKSSIDDNAAKLLIQKCSSIQVDNNFGIQNQFHGHTKAGKEDYLAWRLDFTDRAGRLNWDDETKCRQWIANWHGQARQHLLAEQYRATKDNADMFTTNFKKLVDWADEVYAAGGSTYCLDFRQSNYQKDGETFHPFVTRATVDRGRFNTVHKEYLMSHLVAQVYFLGPFEVQTKPTQTVFGKEAAATIDERVQELARLAASRGESSQFLLDPRATAILSNWHVTDLNAGVTACNDDIWERRCKVDEWIHLNHEIIDGMSNKNAQREAYKERDKVFATTDLSGIGMWEATKKLIMDITKIEARHRNEKTIYTNSNARQTNIGGVSRRSTSRNRNRSKSRSPSAKRKKNRKNKAKVNSVANDDNSRPDEQSRPATQAAAIGESRGRGRPGGRAPRTRDDRAPGESWTGSDQLIRTPGAICDHCGFRGHKTIHCGRAAAEARTGAVQVDSLRAELRHSNHVHH